MEKTDMKNTFRKEKIALTAFFAAICVILLALSIFLSYYSAYGDVLFTILGDKSVKEAKYDEMNKTAKKGLTVFFGDSLTEFYDTSSAFPEIENLNRGISGDTTSGMLSRLDNNLLPLEPSRVIFLGGANDLNRGVTPEKIAENIREILTEIKTALPDCEVFVESLYPVNPNTKPVYLNSVADRKNEDILKVNALIEPICAELGCTYIDVNSLLSDADGNLREELTMDGLHVNADGYAIVTAKLNEYLIK